MTMRDFHPGLRKTYPRNWASPPFEALKGISLTVDEGEVFGFIGPNGAGKSTAIKILTGVMRPDAGRPHCSASMLASRKRVAVSVMCRKTPACRTT
jgi:ABC-type multidrug transport system ATPase subunit